MKTKITASQVIAIVVAVALSAVVANYDKLLPHRWQTYTATDGTFSIELPGKFTVDQIQVPIDGGGTAPINMVSADPNDSTSYSCTYVATDSTDTRSSDEILAASRDGMLHKVQGTVTTQTKIEVDGYPALEVQANARQNSVLDARLIFTGNRMYMLMAVAGHDDREAKTVQRMMGSFKVLRK